MKKTKFEINKIEFIISSSIEITKELQQEIYDSIMQEGVMMFHDDYNGDNWIFDMALIKHTNITIENTRITFTYGENDKILKVHVEAKLIKHDADMSVSKESEKMANLIVSSL